MIAMKIFFITLGLIITLALLLLLMLMVGYAFMSNAQLLPYLRILFLVFTSGMILFIGVLVKIPHGKDFLNK